MFRRSLAVPVLLLTLCSASGLSTAAIATSEDLQRVAEAFYKLDIDTARAHDVTNAIIVRDIGTIRMTKGVLIFSQAVEGVTPIAIFMGEGNFTITPVRKMDREMLDIAAKEHLKQDLGGMINTKVTEAFFVAYDGTWEHLKPALSPARATTSQEAEQARKVLSHSLTTIHSHTGHLLALAIDDPALPEVTLIEEILGQPEAKAAGDPTTFLAEISTVDLGWLSLAWRPAVTYEFRLGIREDIGGLLDYHPFLITHKRSDLDANGRFAADPNADLHEAIALKANRMSLEIPTLDQINLETQITFAPKLEGLKAVIFDLSNDVRGPRWDSRAKWIDVKSIKDASGNDLAFLHRKSKLIVLTKETLKLNQNVTWSFVLDENTVTQFSSNHYSLLNTYPWYPQYGYLGGRFTIDWTIKTPKPAVATGSGKAIRTYEEGRYNVVNLVSERPVQFPSVIFGRYQSESTSYVSSVDNSTVAASVYSWPNTRFSVEVQQEGRDGEQRRGVVELEINVPGGKPKDVLDEGREIIKFLEDLYGPFPFDELHVAMMAPNLGFGQAPPGFIQLTGEAFMSSSALANIRTLQPDFFHAFFSHETAHQWWGHKIGWLTPEDQWLSESFAEYSAGLYVLNLQSKKSWQDKKGDWRERAVRGDPHGSIAWSGNVSGTNFLTYRIDLIYNKGPLVVHMLRMQMGLDNFKKAMKSVFQKYGYTSITTDLLQRECELVVGYKLDFFFDQWFRGTGIPVFDYTWKSEPQSDGKHLVTINISQRDKANFKQVLMPVYFHFKGQKEPVIKARPILKADDVYQIKLPEKPVRVSLDEDHDLLADIISPDSESGQ